MDQIGEKALDLGSVRFTGKIDYVTVQTAGRTALPSLKGRAVWPKSHGGRRLTIHDAVRGDVDAIVATLGNLRLVEFEIAIDVRPAPHVPESCRRKLLEQVMVDIFARGLDPSAGQGMSSAFRAFYRRLDKGYVVQPFNIALPRPTDQQLHGGRHDIVQVKGYLKKFDQKRALASQDHVARVEVRLGIGALLMHGIEDLSQLIGFGFRKQLMPYFRHVQGTKRVVRLRRGQKASESWVPAAAAWLDRIDQEHWKKSGAGAFVGSGKRRSDRVKFVRDIETNNRIGQALMRLQRQFRADKFVRPARCEGGEAPVSMRVPERLGQSPMTTQKGPYSHLG